MQHLFHYRTTTTTATTKTNKTNKQTRKKRIFTSPDRLKICYLKVKRDNIDGYRRGSRKVLKCSGQKSLRKEEPWYPENLPKKQSYYYGKANIRKKLFWNKISLNLLGVFHVLSTFQWTELELPDQWPTTPAVLVRGRPTHEWIIRITQ